MDPVFDVAVIGGGINGCGIAADAALRGLSVILFDKEDLAAATSSSSTKLIHGGLRYLEYYDFSLVKKALLERQRLLELAPYLVQPVPFILPHHPSMRSLWFLRLGLFLYDYLAHENKLPSSRRIRRIKNADYFMPLNAMFNQGLLYYDCATDDARLTLTNALQAKQYGAKIHPYSEVTQAQVNAEGLWQIEVSTAQATRQRMQAKVLVNATGPWGESVNNRLGIHNEHALSLVKGSHIVVRQFYSGEHAYVLQHTDKRVLFMLPYYGQTLIGTTEIAFTGSLENARMTEDEWDYFCTIIAAYFKKPLKKEDILYSFSGVRPLLAQEGTESKALSRDYVLQWTSTPAPALTVYGGKLTTYRQLALEAVDALKVCFSDLKPSKTAKIPLPGSVWQHGSYAEYCVYAAKKYAWLDATIRARLLRQYGTRMELFLSDCENISQLGEHFGHGLYQREVNYLCEQEWAKTAESILWRRTKLGLIFNTAEKKRLQDYIP